MSVFKNLRSEFNKYGKVQTRLRHDCLYVLIYLISFFISFVGLLSTDVCVGRPVERNVFHHKGTGYTPYNG